MQGSEAGIETRKNILHEARNLFAIYGYEGTSVRQIAQKSKVNLAAISYHFKGKPNLFFEVMQGCYQEAYLIVEDSAKRTKNLESLALRVFEQFLERRESLRLTMKLMLTDVRVEMESTEQMHSLNELKGPPGGEFFANRAEVELSQRLSAEKRLWVSKTVFGLIAHWAMVCSSNNYPELLKAEPLLSERQFKKDLKLLVRAVLNQLK